MAIPKSASYPRMTLVEFLHLEDHSGVKHEFHDGTAIAMAGASPEHVTIAGNLITALNNRLRGKPCRPYMNDLRIWVRKKSKMLYPDASIICGPLDRPDNNPDRSLVCNPRVVFEIVSPSSKDYDRKEKLEYYSLLSSLEEYVLIYQDSPYIESRLRKPGVTATPANPTRVTGVQKSLKLRSVGLVIPLSEIYDGLHFAEPESSVK